MYEGDCFRFLFARIAVYIDFLLATIPTFSARIQEFKFYAGVHSIQENVQTISY